MELTGILKVKFDTQVVSEKFQKRDFVLETEYDTQYPQLISLQLTQDKCKLIDHLNEGDMIKVNFNVRGREWNGPQGVKYFNTLEAWRVDIVPGTMRSQPTQQTNTPEPTINNDDLPF